MRILASIAISILLVSSASSVAGKTPIPFTAVIDHIAISVANADKSANFYSDLFGFKQVPAPVPMARWLVMANGVMLHIVGNGSSSNHHSRWDHFALACPDMDAFISMLNDRHIVWTNMTGSYQPQIRADGVKQIFIQDPDGYWIEINDAKKYK